jgi:DNA primase
MSKRSTDWKKSRLSLVTSWKNGLSDLAKEYLAKRGISEATASLFALGSVPDNAEGPERMFRGRLAIPYLHYCPVKGGTVGTVKFRLLPQPETDKPSTGKPPSKYLGYPGEKAKLFNPYALYQNTDYLCITEGEIDCISAVQAGLPAVGLPGANTWKMYLSRLFLGYKEIFVLADDDDAGHMFGETVAKNVPNGRVIIMPHGDVNGTLVATGEEGLRTVVGKEV